MKLFSLLNKCFTILTVALICSIQIDCKKAVDVSPPITSLTSDNVFSDNATAASAISDLYVSIVNGPYYFGPGVRGISLKAGLSADELSLNYNDPTLQAFYSNSLTNQTLAFWEYLYKCLLPVNTAIEKLSNSPQLTPAVKQQLLGEAKFMRGFCYFYLVNFYGDVPLVLSSDYRNNSSLTRAPKSQVYQQIISDLNDAVALLNAQYVSSDAITPTAERVRPTKWAANALLARTYLYIAKWSEAEGQATSVISNTTLYDTVPLNSVFLKNSKEAIWQLQPVTSGFNTTDARTFVVPSTGFSATNPVSLSTNLVNSFETNDKRKIIGNWINKVVLNGTTYYYPYKYKINAFNASVTSTSSISEYSMVLRLAEQYLIRAEARAQLGNMSGAQADLNIIRKRAGLPDTTFSSQQTLLSGIQHERQVELFTEWGDRWLNLNRTGAIDSVMATVCPQKGGMWNLNWRLYPLPINDIQLNPNLRQNPGY